MAEGGSLRKRMFSVVVRRFVLAGSCSQASKLVIACAQRVESVRNLSSVLLSTGRTGKRFDAATRWSPEHLT